MSYLFFSIKYQSYKNFFLFNLNHIAMACKIFSDCFLIISLFLNFIFNLFLFKKITLKFQAFIFSILTLYV